MSASRLFRTSLSVVVVVVAGACSSPGRAEPPRPTPSATRTTVEFGPDAVLVAEIVHIGADAQATVRTPAGLYGEEILLADDHYVRMPDARAVLGGDRWIHTDLSDPRQRRYLEQNPAGFIALADLRDLRVGDEVAGHEIVHVRRARGLIVLDLGGDRTIYLTTETIDDPQPIVAPEESEVVDLEDLAAG